MKSSKRKPLEYTARIDPNHYVMDSPWTCNHCACPLAEEYVKDLDPKDRLCESCGLYLNQQGCLPLHRRSLFEYKIKTN